MTAAVGVRMPALKDAACRLPENRARFNHVKGPGAQLAIRVCRTCWDRPDCLAWALEYEDSGIWGGYGPTGLRQLRTEFGIAYQELTAGNLAVLR